MINTLHSFLYMGGYGWFVWGAYSSVVVLLLIQWLLPWRRMRRYLREQQAKR